MKGPEIDLTVKSIHEIPWLHLSPNAGADMLEQQLGLKFIDSKPFCVRLTIRNRLAILLGAPKLATYLQLTPRSLIHHFSTTPGIYVDTLKTIFIWPFRNFTEELHCHLHENMHALIHQWGPGITEMRSKSSGEDRRKVAAIFEEGLCEWGASETSTRSMGATDLKIIDSFHRYVLEKKWRQVESETEHNRNSAAEIALYWAGHYFTLTVMNRLRFSEGLTTEQAFMLITSSPPDTIDLLTHPDKYHPRFCAYTSKA